MLALPAVLFLSAFFVAPLIDNLIPTSGSEVYYKKLLTDAYYLRVTGVTVLLSLSVALISLVVGYPVAYFLVYYSGRWRGLLIFLLIAPLLTSVIMRTVGWQVIFARRGLINNMLLEVGLIEQPVSFLNTPTAVVIGLVHVLLPYMVLSIAAVLQGLNPGLKEAARILGAGRIRAFFLVTFPLSLDGVATGLLLVFMLANGSFVSLLLLGGGSVQNLPLLIYQQFTTTRDFEFAAAMSNVLLVVAFLTLTVQLRLVRTRKDARLS